MSALVTTDWLTERLHHPEIKVMDASWHMPQDKRDAQAEYKDAHIPGAVFADIDKLSDADSSYPHMAPSPDLFAQAMGALGVGDTHHVVVYDTQGLFSAARLWWMLRVYGHERVSVLDGGFPKWRKEGRQMESGEISPQAAVFTAAFNPYLGAEAAHVLEHTRQKTATVLDARSAERFAGSVPEPRPGVRSGHIPGSLNVPFGTLLNADKTMKKPAELKELFQRAGVDFAKPVITSCGSGVTACILALGLYECGRKDVAVYDGSWAQWGAREELPVA